MQPTNTILAAIQTLLADDVGTLAAVTAMHCHLIKAPFTPSETTDFTALSEADFTGGAAKSAGTGNQQAFSDPISGQRIVQVLEPAGGWHWQATALTNLPQTIFGYALTDTANAVTYGAALLDDPVELTGVGDGVDIPQLRFTFSLNPLS